MGVSGGDESGALPFLEIEPAERLFDYILNPELCGQSFRSELYNRQIRVEFGSHRDHGGPPWVAITGDDPRCALIHIGWEGEESGMTGGACYFSAGQVAAYSDDDLWFNIEADDIRKDILVYLERTMNSGLVECWRGDGSNRNQVHGFSFHVDDDHSPGWLKRALAAEQQDTKSTALIRRKFPWHHDFIGIIVVLLLGIPLLVLLSPILVPLILISRIGSVFNRSALHARRYPPFPTE
jgi:hypothetical protein